MSTCAFLRISIYLHNCPHHRAVYAAPPPIIFRTLARCEGDKKNIPVRCCTGALGLLVSSALLGLLALPMRLARSNETTAATVTHLIVRRSGANVEEEANFSFAIYTSTA